MKPLKCLILLAALSLIGFQAKAQVFTKYQSTNASKVFVTGTSTLHNWSENLKKFNVSFQAQNGHTAIIIKNVRFNALVGYLESESSLMSEKTFKALKKEKFPMVSFISDQTTTMSLKGNKFSGKVSGKLTISGTTKQVMIPIQGTLESDSVSVSGVYPVSMAEYGVTPPTALFGTIKAGNSVKIHFNLKFHENNPKSIN